MNTPEIKDIFRPLVVFLVLVYSWGLNAFKETFDDPLGWMSAFGINLIMSIVFILMFLERNDMRGVSITAAWCKMLGTLSTSIECYIWFPVVRPKFPSFAFLHVLYVSIFLLDVIYIVLVHQRASRRKHIKSN